jgi:hypothetical protein
LPLRSTEDRPPPSESGVEPDPDTRTWRTLELLS